MSFGARRRRENWRRCGTRPQVVRRGGVLCVSHVCGRRRCGGRRSHGGTPADDRRDLLEAIVDPSKEISDQYGTIVLKRRDGSHLTGRIVNFNSGTVHVSENLFDPAAVTKVPESEIESIMPSKVSLMPGGLLNVLQPSEVIDLLAFLESTLLH